MKNVPSAAGRTLQLQCALNLMSCYLKSAKFEECVDEGSEVLTYDSSNVKAYYRRGQAYRELGNLEAAVADLSKAHEISPEDETIAQVFRDTEGKLANLPKGLVIEEIVEEGSSETSSATTDVNNFQPLSPHNEIVNNQRMDQPSPSSPPSTADMQEIVSNSMKDPAMRQMFASMVQSMSPDMMANISKQFGMVSKEDAAKVQQAMSSLSLEDLDKMVKWMDRAQRAAEVAKRAKNWLVARKGLIIAIVILIVAFILQRFGFIGR